MSFTVTAKQVNEITNEKKFREELCGFLNSIIDEEIKKGDNMNAELIDRCIDALDELQSENTAPALKIVLTEKDILKYCRKAAKMHSAKHARAAVAACLIIILSGATVLNANPALAQQTKDFFSRIIYELGITAENSIGADDENISSIYAVFPEDMQFTVKSESDISLDDIKIYAVYKNSAEKEVDIDDCTVKTVRENSNISVIIAYRGCALSLTYTLER